MTRAMISATPSGDIVTMGPDEAAVAVIRLINVFTELPNASCAEDFERLLPTQIEPAQLQSHAG